mmetsp:Transcript_22925/g.34733  ORF Transcript_22925/g.34733 Transcript_22925/m.34733 type:complete len:323 (-) Transcript_22925:2519-3487(-)
MMMSLLSNRRRFLSCYCYYATASAAASSSPQSATARVSVSTSAFLSSLDCPSLHRRRSMHQQKPPPIPHYQQRCFGRNSKSKSNRFQHKFMKVSAKGKQQHNDDGVDEEGAAVTLDPEEQENEEIKETTLNWIKKVVIGLNLCPFAEKPLRQNQLKVSVVRGNDDETVAAAVVYELIARSDEQHDGTTVVVAPEFYPDDFVRYMDLVQYIEDDVMEEHDLHGLVQIAPFHPKFAFAGSGDGIDNYTNRSPYPMFHILRENEVGLAVDKLGGDASKVWQRNVDLLEGMDKKFGRDDVKKIMKGESLDGLKEMLRDLRGYSEKS